MSEKCNCGCCFTWLSGFFAMPALGHILRIIVKWDVTWQGQPVSMQMSWAIAISTGILAVIFGIIGCKRGHGGDKPVSSCCP